MGASNDGLEKTKSDVKEIDGGAEVNENMCVDNESCGLDIDFGSLTKVDTDFDLTWSIGMIKEDRYKPGTFYFTSGAAIWRYVPGQEVSVLLGNETQKDINSGYRDGRASEALFSLINGFVQLNQSQMAIADYINGCIRLYDFTTGNVSTIVGVCDARGRRIASDNWQSDHKGMRNSTDSQFNVVYSVIFLERWNKLLCCDNSLIIQNDFASQKTSLLDSNLYENSPGTRHIIADSEENNIYINHGHGVSRYNLHTRETSLLFGTVSIAGHSDKDFLLGPFSTAQTGLQERLNWLVRDQVLVAAEDVDVDVQALVFIDLRQEGLYSMCKGKNHDYDYVQTLR